MLERNVLVPAQDQIDSEIVDPAATGARYGAISVALTLMVGPLVTLGVFAAGGPARLAYLLGVIGGWWALWAIRWLPIHLAPLLALLVLSLFSLEPASALMSGFGTDGVWWILGSWMLALAAWETGLIGVLLLPQRGPLALVNRLLAGLAGLYGTRAALFLKPFAARESRASHVCFALGRMVGLPSHALNLFALALLPIASIERYSLINWLVVTLPLAAGLALLSALQKPVSPASASSQVELSTAVRITPLQGLAAVALLVAWGGAASGSWHGLPAGIWFLYLGLMAVAAGLLSIKKFWRDLDWPLWLTLGVGIGLGKTVAKVLAPILTDMVTDRAPPWMMALALIVVCALACRQLGILRSALIMLPLVLALAPAYTREPAGWMLLALMTHHWLDMCEVPVGRTRLAAAGVCVAGLALISVTAVVWLRLGVL